MKSTKVNKYGEKPTFGEKKEWILHWLEVFFCWHQKQKTQQSNKPVPPKGTQKKRKKNKMITRKLTLNQARIVDGMAQVLKAEQIALRTLPHGAMQKTVNTMVATEIPVTKSMMTTRMTCLTKLFGGKENGVLPNSIWKNWNMIFLV